jgi:hypothetical protein
MNTTSEVKELCLAVGAFVVAGVLGFFALATSGCAARRVPLSNAAGEAIVRAVVRGDSALGHVRAAIPDASPQSKAHLTTADVELVAQHGDLGDAKKAVAEKDQTIAKQQRDYDKLDGRWYVWVGRRIQLLLIVAAIAWVGAGVAGVFLGPIGTTVLNMLPLAGPWHWLRERRLSPL